MLAGGDQDSLALLEGVHADGAVVIEDLAAVLNVYSIFDNDRLSTIVAEGLPLDSCEYITDYP